MTKLIAILFLFFHLRSSSQHFAVSADKNNILYIGISNPLSIAVENIPSNKLVIKTDNGLIGGYNGKYEATPNIQGKATYFIFKKNNGKLKKVAEAIFRVKHLPNPVFRIGPCGSGCVILKKTLVNQQFVRVDLENFDIDARFQIKKFTVCIISNDTCKFKELENIGNELNNEIKNQFNLLRTNDQIIFKKIIAYWPDKTEVEIEPIIIAIKV